MDNLEFAFLIVTGFILILQFQMKRDFDKLKRYFEAHQHSKKMKDVLVIE